MNHFVNDCFYFAPLANGNFGIIAIFAVNSNMILARHANFYFKGRSDFREDSRHNTPRPGPDDVYYCPMCDNYTDVHQIMIPYAFKLMIQELMAMNIAPRIRVQKHIDV